MSNASRIGMKMGNLFSGFKFSNLFGGIGKKIGNILTTISTKLPTEKIVQGIEKLKVNPMLFEPWNYGSLMPRVSNIPESFFAGGGFYG